MLELIQQRCFNDCTLHKTKLFDLFKVFGSNRQHKMNDEQNDEISEAMKNYTLKIDEQKDRCIFPFVKKQENLYNIN